MRRSLGASVLISLILTLLPSPALARGVWDPDDTRGRLDIRWVGVRYRDDGYAVLTVTLYPGFRRSALPKAGAIFGPRHFLGASLDTHMLGVFFRKNGRIKLSFGDHASTCCRIYRVRRPDLTTLTVRYLPIDEDPPGHRVSASSIYRRSTDDTDTFRIGSPPD